MTDKRVEIAALDITAMRASLATFTGYAAVEVESYRQDVGALLDALEAANAEAARRERAAVVAWLRSTVTARVLRRLWRQEPMDAAADAIERGEHRRKED
jgi:hypothetical protein